MNTSSASFAPGQPVTMNPSVLDEIDQKSTDIRVRAAENAKLALEKCKNGDSAGARKTAEEMLKEVEKLSGNGFVGLLSYPLALAHIHFDQPEKALSTAKDGIADAAKESPQDIDLLKNLYVVLTQANLEQGKRDEAVQALKEAIEKAELDERVSDLLIGVLYERLSLIYKHLANYHEAIKALQKAIELENPNHLHRITAFKKHMALYHIELEQYDEAIKALQKAIKVAKGIKPDTRYCVLAELYAVLYRAHNGLNQHDEATRALQKKHEAQEKSGHPGIRFFPADLKK